MCSPSLVTVHFLGGLDNFSVNGHFKRWASFGPSPKPSSIFVLVISAYICVVREFQLLLLWLQRCVVCDDIWIYWRWEVLWQQITFHNTKCLSSYWLLQALQRLRRVDQSIFLTASLRGILCHFLEFWWRKKCWSCYLLWLESS